MISERTSDDLPFEYGYPHSNALLKFELKLERCKPHTTARHPTKSDVINDVKLFPSQTFYIIHSDVALQTKVH